MLKAARRRKDVRGVRIVSSCFGIGYLPWMPGTYGSLAGMALAWVFHDHLLVWTLGLSVIGLALCKPAQTAFGVADPPVFVLDEVCGMLVSLLALPRTPLMFWAAFVLFRVADIWKPWPIRWFQENKGAANILWDDLAAGLFVNAGLQILIRIF